MTDVAREIVNEAARDFLDVQWVGGRPVEMICIQDYELQEIIERRLAEACGKASGIAPGEMAAAVKGLGHISDDPRESEAGSAKYETARTDLW